LEVFIITSKRQPYKIFIKAFKLAKVCLISELDKSSSEIATELRIRRNQRYKWKEQFEVKGDKASSNKLGRPLKEDQSEVSTLR
jgi:transposase-like protein